MIEEPAMVGELTKKIEQEYEKHKRESQKANILLVGGTGVGKSSLINMIFGANYAQTGTGRPVTSEIVCYSGPDMGINIYDSVGYELGSDKEKEFFSQIDQRISRQEAMGKDAIHAIWYCISSMSHRVTEFDIDTIRQLQGHKLSVAVVFTKSDGVSEENADILRKVIEEAFSKRIPSFLTSTTHPEISKDKELVAWTMEILPEQVKESFVVAQKRSLEAKWQMAHKWLAGHVAGAAIIGASPIPFSDAPLLVANQAVMISKIMQIYELQDLQSYLKNLGLGGALGSIAATLGKSLAGNLLKLIPVIGTIVGGLVNATVAGTMTLAMGEGINYACYNLYQKILDGTVKAQDLESFATWINDYAKSAMKSKKDKPEDFRLPRPDEII